MNEETGYGLRMRVVSWLHRHWHHHEPDWYVDYISCTERCATCDFRKVGCKGYVGLEGGRCRCGVPWTVHT